MKGCRSITPIEIQSIGVVLNIRDLALFILGLRTGFRISELLSLNLIDVLTPEMNIKEYVRVSKMNTKGKHESKTLPLHDDARFALKMYIDATGDLFSDRVKKLNHGISPLFISKRGKRVNRFTADHNFKVALKKAGITYATGELGLHSWRKTFAKNIYHESGDNLFKLQHALGHSHIGTTVKYLQEDMEEINDIIRRVK